jgi:hypothetical protein
MHEFLEFKTKILGTFSVYEILRCGLVVPINQCRNALQ